MDHFLLLEQTILKKDCNIIPSLIIHIAASERLLTSIISICPSKTKYTSRRRKDIEWLTFKNLHFIKYNFVEISFSKYNF